MNRPSNAFEVEFIPSRRNETYWFLDGSVPGQKRRVEVFNTTMIFRPLAAQRPIVTIEPPMPFDYGDDVEGYFMHLYEKALAGHEMVSFLAWIDPEKGIEVEPS
jgi:hypothetical protein